LVKAAGHGIGEFVQADEVDRTVSPRDVAPVAELLADRFPERSFSHVRSATCLYTRTPDGHFIIDRHPMHGQVLLASACNGFGFKFASAVGEGLAAMAADETPPVDLSAWRLSR
jgi:glycine/D-amino acid oxidase-like deaminating enzyme